MMSNDELEQEIDRAISDFENIKTIIRGDSDE
ncbi:MAG: hypothetical protein AMQ22_00040 [Candidatus Methanofastidiosum methylothiophilum]|uniref:Uncharacterized protein n=1 Tax=Candidatus Methanofastidiosum methylothiophilum TaxID=1705564 RepID=A0A150J9F8_9EURY|nr:MAG: hypothetical protein AMQ22_00040 [Candidatus Methanofastidiosum methylthiophilus]